MVLYPPRGGECGERCRLPCLEGFVRYALARDALRSVQESPLSAPLWQRLSALVKPLEGAEREALLHALTVMDCEAAPVQWLRCSAMACLTRDLAWLVRQAACVGPGMSTDALMGLLGLAWYQALAHTGERAHFVRLFQALDAPGLQREVAQRMDALPPAVARVPAAPLRVAVYTPEIVSPQHGGTMLLMQVMRALAGQGVDVHGFSAKEMNISEHAGYTGGSEFLYDYPLDVSALTGYMEGAVPLPLTVAHTGFSLRHRLGRMQQDIVGYRPDVVFFIGWMSPLVYQLQSQYPVVGLSLHALPPLAPVDVWLRADPHSTTSGWEGLPAPQPLEFPFRFEPQGQAVPMERSALGLPADAVLLVTAGYRLDTEIAAPWSMQMQALLESQPGWHWLLVGVSAEQTLTGLVAHPRIHRVAPQKTLGPWLAMADIYVNPPRMGGGGALAQAMEQALPVLTMADSDGGDKVGSWAVHSMESFWARLCVWGLDPVARQEAGAQLQARFHERLDFSAKAAATGLVNACVVAMERFEQRRETGDA